jgi:hypothetical protein
VLFIFGAGVVLSAIVGDFFTWLEGNSIGAKVMQTIFAVAAIAAILYGMHWVTVNLR